MSIKKNYKCVEGFVKNTDIVRSMVANGSILNMPQFNREEVNELCKTFNMYVNFSERRCPEIKKAEGNSKESQLAYDNLKAEFVDKYWKKVLVLKILQKKFS